MKILSFLISLLIVNVVGFLINFIGVSILALLKFHLNDGRRGGI